MHGKCPHKGITPTHWGYSLCSTIPISGGLLSRCVVSRLFSPPQVLNSKPTAIHWLSKARHRWVWGGHVYLKLLYEVLITTEHRVSCSVLLVSMFPSEESSSSRSHKQLGVEVSPLRSVENRLDLCSSGRSPHQGAGVGGSPRTPRHPAVKMNNSDSCHNNNVTISTVIRTEPFSDFYVVEEEIGR